MDFCFFSPFILFAVVISCLNKRVQIGDLIDIRIKKQPILFVIVVIMLCLVAFDCLCNALALFNRSIFSKDFLDLLDYGTFFLFYLVLSIVVIGADRITINKKNITWNETPLIRGIVLLVVFSLSIFYLV